MGLELCATKIIPTGFQSSQLINESIVLFAANCEHLIVKLVLYHDQAIYEIIEDKIYSEIVHNCTVELDKAV